MDAHQAFHSDEDALAAYVAQLIRTTATLMGILEHMARSIASAPDAPPVDAVLSRLLCDVLGRPLAREHPRAAIEGTAAILAETTETIASELALVPVEGPSPRPRRPNGAQRRGRRPG